MQTFYPKAPTMLIDYALFAFDLAIGLAFAFVSLSSQLLLGLASLSPH